MARAHRCQARVRDRFGDWGPRCHAGGLPRVPHRARRAGGGEVWPCPGRWRGGVMTASGEPVRCRWVGISEPIYTRYHDEEWGVPHANDRAMFEKLVLEGFQAGLSWLTILKKRENFRRAFHGFDAERIVRYGAEDIARLMADPGIVRNRLKVEATIDNARALLKLAQRTRLSAFLWAFLDGRPQINRHRSFKTVPAETPASKTISKALKAEGFRFVG